MKNNLILFLGGIVLGTCVGGAIGWYLTKRHYEQEVLNAQADAEYFRNRYNERENDTSDIERVTKIQEEEDVDQLKEQLENLKFAVNSLCDDNMKGCINDLVKVRTIRSQMTREGYDEEDITKAIINNDASMLINDNDYDPSSVTIPDVDLEFEHEEEGGDVQFIGDLRVSEQVVEYPDPYLITQEDYLDNIDGYDQIALTYFSADDTLCDTDDDILDQENLGVAELMLEFARTGDDAIYIRDEKKCIEYEILWDDAAYQVAVLGQNPEALLLLPRIFREG